MIQIQRLFGCVLNPKDSVVNAIIKRIEKCEGHCPCVPERNDDTICPCKHYRESGECHCQLYVKPTNK